MSRGHGAPRAIYKQKISSEFIEHRQNYRPVSSISFSGLRTLAAARLSSVLNEHPFTLRLQDQPQKTVRLCIVLEFTSDESPYPSQERTITHETLVGTFHDKRAYQFYGLLSRASEAVNDTTSPTNCSATILTESFLLEDVHKVFSSCSRMQEQW